MKKFTAIGLIICTTFILVLSGQNGTEAFGMTYRLALPFAAVVYGTPDYDQILAVMNGIRFLGRIAVFTTFGVFFTTFIHTWKNFLSQKAKTVMSVLGIILFGIFDETHKLLIDGRHCTVIEIVVNVICGLAGAAAALYIIKKFRKT